MKYLSYGKLIDIISALDEFLQDKPRKLRKELKSGSRTFQLFTSTYKTDPSLALKALVCYKFSRNYSLMVDLPDSRILCYQSCSFWYCVNLLKLK